MDIVKLAVDLFISNIGKSGTSNLSASTVSSALQGLLGGADGKLDIGDLVSRFSGSGLQSAVSSWLGDGANQALSAKQVVDILGNGPVSEFASKLGLSSDVASEGLATTIPQIIDKASSGGSLLGGDALGKALGGLSGMFGR